jgi:hypothetical protein
MIHVEVFTDRKEVRARSPKDGWLYRMIRAAQPVARSIARRTGQPEARR